MLALKVLTHFFTCASVCSLACVGATWLTQPYVNLTPLACNARQASKSLEDKTFRQSLPTENLLQNQKRQTEIL